MIIRSIKIFLVIFIIFLTAHAQEKTLAFPGAEGYAKYASGGRGGDVYTVTTLSDSGLGSLREGISSKLASTPRTIVFAVGGRISLNNFLDIRNKRDITIAGESAPSAVVLTGWPFRIHNSENIIVRYLGVRLTDENCGSGFSSNDGDALNIQRSNLVMLDHISASWGLDEVISTTFSTNVTISNSIIAEGLDITKSGCRNNHSRGTLARGYVSSAALQNHTDGISIIGNIFMSNRRRSPAVGSEQASGTECGSRTGLFHITNNLIYNFGEVAGHIERCNGIKVLYGGNYVMEGPDSELYWRTGKPLPNPNDPNAAQPTTSAFAEDLGKTQGQTLDHNYIYAGRVIYETLEGTLKDTDTLGHWSLIREFESHEKFGASASPLPHINLSSPMETYVETRQKAGLSISRDPTELRLLEELENKSGSIIDTSIELNIFSELDLVAQTTQLLTDTDGGGVPDVWETNHGLNPNDSSDESQLVADSSYSWLERYLHESASCQTPIAPSISMTPVKPGDIISWDSDPIATSYELELISSSTNTTYQTSTNSWQIDPNITEPHSVRVRARNQIGGCRQVSDWSEIVEITAEIEEPPKGTLSAPILYLLDD